MAKHFVNKRRTTTSRKKKSVFSRNFKTFVITVFLFLLIGGVAYHYRNGLAYYFSYKTNKTLREKRSAKIAAIRNYQIMTRHSDKVVGVDVSEYQGSIDWSNVGIVDGKFPVKFILIRATAGNNRVDSRFKDNWKRAKQKKIVRGAYHYYRPNENSLAQAEFFIKNVQLKKGDLPPVLDIEKLPKNQSIDSLKVGLKRWLKRVEQHYGVQPIIYSGESYYNDFLEDEFDGYTFWIANYNLLEESINSDWQFWQFTERATVKGINGNVDLNIFNGSVTDLKYLTIGN